MITNRKKRYNHFISAAKQKGEIKEEPAESKELTRTLKGVMRVGVLAKVTMGDAKV